MSAKTGYLQASSSQWENLVPLVQGSVINLIGLSIVIDALKIIKEFFFREEELDGFSTKSIVNKMSEKCMEQD
jgi:hypothetical protein